MSARYPRETCDATCGEGNAHSPRCRVAWSRRVNGRASRARQLTAEDHAAIDRVCAADRLPDHYFAGQRMVVRNTGDE